nr:helix-turn-helix transcriptional regulator [uncultured Ruminococcus sp.]
MAEFGENIRKAREEMGITQQTLADKLYVTRQAVSRWENGSRYPDLLTAKALAKSLDTSLDDLLTDDDMRTYPEVNPVIEYPLHKRVQTALFAAAVVTNLIEVIWYIGFILTANDRAFMTEWEKVAQLAGAISAALITGVLIYGLMKSIKDRITPNIAARIAVMIVGVDMLIELVVQYCKFRNLTYTITAEVIAARIAFSILYQLIDAAFIVSVLLFFCGKKPHSPIPVYIWAGLAIVGNLYGYLLTYIGTIGTPQITKYMMTSSLRIFAQLLIPILFIYMTAVLHRKRKLAKTQA